MAEAAKEFEPVTPEELTEMGEAGFSEDEVNNFRVQSMQEMAHAGFSQKEVEEFYGAQVPDMKGSKALIEQNFAKHRAENTDAEGKQKEAQSFMEALEAGWDMSVTGLALSGKPDTVLPADAPRASRIASQVAQLAGDLPAMVAGWAGGATVGAGFGGAAGSVVPGVGTLGGIAIGGTVGGSAGAFAAPAAMRKAMMDHYEKGDIKTFGEFWDRTSGVLWEAAKQGAVGAATGGAGMAAGKALGATAPVIAKSGSVAAEIGTMVTVGKAIEGEMPNADDFIDAAIVVGGLHAVSKVGKFRTIYEKTGLKPEQIAEMAEKDPILKQEILSEAPGLPASLEKSIDPMATKMAKLADEQAAKSLAKPPTPSEAQAKILEKIGDKPTKEKEGYSFQKAYKDFVDKLDPINNFVEATVGKEAAKNLPVAENPYKIARLVNDYKAKALHAIEKGTIDFKTLETNGKGLTEIVEPHMKDLNGFRAFLASERALEIEASGRKSGFDVEAAKQVVKEGKATYGTAAKELVDFQRRTLKYLKDSGRLSDEAYAAILAKGEKYIPFNRILEDIEAGGSGKSGFLKELKGSEAAIQDPFLSIAENTEKIFKLAEVNRAQRATVEFNIEAFEKVEATNRALRQDEVQIWRNGEREVFRGDKDLVEALKSLEGNAASQNILFKLMRGFTAVKRLGITLTPDFILKNFQRDQVTASTFSKTSKNPFTSAAETLIAMGDLFKKNDNYYNWLKSGGANGAFLEINSKYLEKQVFKLDKETGFIKSVQNAVTSPKELFGLKTALQKSAAALARAGNIVESAPRLAEFKRTSKTKGTLEGGFASREATVDFQRIGAKMAALNAITAFQNVSIQGLDRTVRAVKENPKEVGTKVAAYIVAPSVYLWWAQHDDPRYKEIPRWQKDLHWIILTDDWQKASADDVEGLPEHLIRETKDGGYEVNRGTIYRIPKPQELGMVGSIAERVLDKYVDDNPDAGADLGQTIREMIVPSLAPDAFVPPLEHMANYNSFTGRPLVPEYLEKQLPAYRYTDYTTETSKALGKLLGSIPVVQEKDGASPMVIENYVRGWTGSLGMYALQLADYGLIKTDLVEDPVKPAWTVADIPAVKAFVVRYPSAQAESIQRFYEHAEKAEMVMTTLKSQMKKGDEAEVEYLMGEYEDQLQNLKGYKDALSKQSQFIHAVQRQKDWTPEEKRQMIELTYYQMIEISKQGLEMSREMEKALKEQ